ncbi:MAG: hypothetical protein K9J13_06945 [Saprospiraceae bacterium]|nr:hypothetical protein [Saprospiraceae bacterium]
MILFCDNGGIREVEGSWTSNSDTICLTTIIQPNPSILVNIVEDLIMDELSNDTTDISFSYQTDSIDLPFSMGEIIINDTIEEKLDMNGTFKTTKIKVEKIKGTSII